MLNVFAKSFMTATRNAPHGTSERRWDAPSHWARGERFDTRRNAEIEAHLSGLRL